jgi:hypothetical protein
MKQQEEPSRRPAFQWQREYWDTFMRDEEQERKAVRYIENNPIKAKLSRISEVWSFSSARFRDEFQRLFDSSRNAGFQHGAILK